MRRDNRQQRKAGLLAARRIRAGLIGQIAKRTILRDPTRGAKRAILSYIVEPFLTKRLSPYHSNNQESIAIREILKELGYAVDVADYKYPGRIDYGIYELILGFGEPLVKSFWPGSEFHGKRIYYGTGMHVCHQNHQSTIALKRVLESKGCLLPECGRIVKKTWSEQTSLVDGMILIGNETVADSYRAFYGGPIRLVPVTYVRDPKITASRESRDFERARTGFLWIGGGGLIHKGLDIALEVFSARPDLDLHICGDLQRERRFLDAYRTELSKPNIHVHGFTNTLGEAFQRIAGECAFVLGLSCSEAMQGSVVNAMAHGLIPVTHKWSTVDHFSTNIAVAELSREALRDAVELALGLPTRELATRSRQTGLEVEDFNSMDAYAAEMGSALTDLLFRNES